MTSRLPINQTILGSGSGCALLLLLRAGSALLYRGPHGAAGGWRKVRRMARMDAGQFFAGTGCAVEKPRNPPAHPEGRMPGGRAIGVPLSLVTFSRYARESDSGADRRTKPLCLWS